MISYDVLDAVVSSVNERAYERYGGGESCLDFSSLGWCEHIKLHCSFDVLWNSEDGDRKWIDDDNQESLLECLARRAEAYVKSVTEVAAILREMADEADPAFEPKD